MIQVEVSFKSKIWTQRVCITICSVRYLRPGSRSRRPDPDPIPPDGQEWAAGRSPEAAAAPCGTDPAGWTSERNGAISDILIRPVDEASDVMIAWSSYVLVP